MAGRRPVPDQIKKLTGSHNALNPNAPRAYHYRTVERVPIPKEIARDPHAKFIWDEVVPSLVANGMLERANLDCFANYCLAYAASRHALDDVFENGRVWTEPILNKQGEHVGDKQRPNPSLEEAAKRRLEMLRHAIEFGLTPAAATRVAASPSGEVKKSFDDLMNEDDDIGTELPTN